MNIDDVKDVLQNAPNAKVIASHMDTNCKPYGYSKPSFGYKK